MEISARPTWNAFTLHYSRVCKEMQLISKQFYLTGRFLILRLASADIRDFDQFAIALGRPMRGRAHGHEVRGHPCVDCGFAVFRY